MIFLPRILPGLCLLSLLGGCNGPAEQTATTAPPADSTASAAAPAADTAARPAAQGQPVALGGQTFRLKAFPLGQPNADAPQFNIYLYPSQRPDSVLVAQDTEPSVLDRDQGPRMGVPKTAVILFQTYNAGAGYHYYATAEGHQLRIYRKRLEEATPENEHAARPAWQLVKTFGFFTDGARPL
ncbi:hypothetical protein [Hymenobacter edaphi]|uniref:hypothetical protein n=1 Tax=Hymenobacter edaphi TaxID=2211146 RepID=UPI0010582DC4|nr:hypothetical protein [Hymenobacter edaphi]